MFRLDLIDNDIKFYIDGIEQKLAFNLNVGYAAEEKFGSYKNFCESLPSIKTARWVLTEMINESIKKYNKHFNTSIKPLSETETSEYAEGDVLDYITAIMGIVLKSSQTKNAETTQATAEK